MNVGCARACLVEDDRRAPRVVRPQLALGRVRQRLRVGDDEPARGHVAPFGELPEHAVLVDEYKETGPDHGRHNEEDDRPRGADRLVRGGARGALGALEAPRRGGLVVLVRGGRVSLLESGVHTCKHVSDPIIMVFT